MIPMPEFLKWFGLEMFIFYIWIRILIWDMNLGKKPKRKPQPKEKVVFKRHDNYPFD